MHETQTGLDRLPDVLSAAQAAARRGDRERAYKLSLQATRLAPQDVQAWLLRADNAFSDEERLFCLSQASAINPNLPAARQKMYTALRRLLDQDPYLAYVDETPDLYRVRNELALAVAVPKYRSVDEPVKSPVDDRLRSAFRLLMWAALGLLVAGVGAIVLAPLAASAAVGAFSRSQRNADRTRALVVMGLAFLVWVAALPLAYILYLHIHG